MPSESGEGPSRCWRGASRIETCRRGLQGLRHAGEGSARGVEDLRRSAKVLDSRRRFGEGSEGMSEPAWKLTRTEVNGENSEG
ncbi:hypothetical protein BHK98_07120 [Hornefia porci]|uniref:Uncharacterized protein n=1 Tax=Hornefia porci TaxID=2652292 RepID=A0A1Q9JI04_9FIRM|nr:hypothetical protein BHK98_07120 [Hornefia porci]